MKRILILLLIIISINSFSSIYAQNPNGEFYKYTENYKKRHAIYDLSKTNLKSFDTVPGFETQEEKLVISGTIYQSDGITPAEGVILYICQADDYGDYNSKKIDGKRILKHQACIKTDANGNYTFYTFVPGTYWPTRDLQEIHGVIKAPHSNNAYAVPHFIFDKDPFLKKSCKKKIEKNALNNILTLKKQDNIHIAKRDFVLQPYSSTL